MSLQVNNNAVMGEEPRWGMGLIIKQLGNLFSIIHVVLVPQVLAGAVSKRQWQCLLEREEEIKSLEQ